MKGDSIIIEEHHRKAAKQIIVYLIQRIKESEGKFALNVSGESGSGKSEIAMAISEELEHEGIKSIVLQQDDYFVYPPKTNDQTRRNDINWVGPQEVHLDVMDQNIQEIMDGNTEIEKPLVIYEDDSITRETLAVGEEKVIIADGTYTSLLKTLTVRTFIDRNYKDTRKHRERRLRHASELDAFIDKVLEIEHGIISSHKQMADLIITKNYDVVKKTG